MKKKYDLKKNMFKKKWTILIDLSIIFFFFLIK